MSIRVGIWAFAIAAILSSSTSGQTLPAAAPGQDTRPIVDLLERILEAVGIVNNSVRALPQKRTPFLVTGDDTTSGLDCGAPAAGDPTPACEQQAIKMCNHIGYGKAWITRYTGPNATRPARIYDMICFD